jgi:hypothetical protein
MCDFHCVPSRFDRSTGADDVNYSTFGVIARLTGSGIRPFLIGPFFSSVSTEMNEFFT